MAKTHATEKLAIFVTPGSEVTEVITDKSGSLKEVWVCDGGPIVAMDVSEDAVRMAEAEDRLQAALDEAADMDDCECDEPM